MLTPKYLENLDYSKVVKIYTDLNIKLTIEIINKIISSKKLDSITKRQLNTLIQAGGKDIFNKALDETTNISNEVKKEISKKFNDMASTNLEGYKKLFDYRNKEFKLSIKQIQILNEGIKKTDGTLKNLTKTIAFETEKKYVEALDNAYWDVVSGGRDYTTVIEETVRNLAGEGITLEDKAGRNVQLETAVRRNLLFGVKDTADEINEDIEKELGCDGYEVTAHNGARPTHAEEQGKQFAVNKKDARKYGLRLWDDVKDLWKEANCRHTYFGIILGISEPVYSKKELKTMKNSKVTYKGKIIPEYEATQVQRRLEREQRELDRQIMILKESGFDYEEELLKLNKKKSEYKKFCKETGLTPDYSRTKAI